MKKVVSALLLLSILFSLLTMSASAVNIIEDVMIVFDGEYVVGERITDLDPRSHLSTTKEAISMNIFYDDGSGWEMTSADQCFASGVDYRFEMWIAPADSYNMFDSGHLPTVTGPAGTEFKDISVYSGGTLYVNMYFLHDAFLPVETVDFQTNVDAFAGDDIAAYKLSLKNESTCGFCGVPEIQMLDDEGSWKKITDAYATFEYDEHYRIEVWLYPKPGYIFSENQFPSINSPKGMTIVTDGIHNEDSNQLRLYLFPEVQTAPPSMFFKDVKTTDWFYHDVKFAYYNKMMNGVGNSLFDPNGTCTRAMVVTVLYRLLGEPGAGLSSPFKDVPEDEWYSSAVKWAHNCGVVKGTSETTFEPNAPITREQLAAILYRFTESLNKETTGGITLIGFTDNDKISSYASDALSWAFGNGIIMGVDNAKGKFLNPQDNATRCQVAAMLHRYYDAFNPFPS